LVVGIHREDFGFFCWYSGVPLDESGHGTASGLDTQEQRCDIKEEQILRFLCSVARKNGSLDGSTVGDGLVRVDALV
jgi:hypothetical protein